VTWPAFWVTYGLNLAGHFTTSGEVDGPIWARVAIVTVSQLVMFVPLVLLRRTIMRDPSRPRPWLALGAFVTAGAVRGVVVAWLLLATGLVTQARWGFRVPASIVNQGTVLVLAALMVDSIREHGQRMRTLLANRSALEQARVRAQALLAERADEAAERLKAILFAEVERIDSQAPEQAAADLHRTAAEVVRPLSHELAASIPPWSPEPIGASNLRLDWAQVLDDATRGRPLRPIATGLALGVIGSAFIFSAFGSQAGVILALAILGPMVTLWAGNRALSRVLAGRSRGARVTLVVGATLAAAGAVAAIVFWTVRASEDRWAALSALLVFMPALALLLTLARAAFEQQREMEGTLERSESDLRVGLVRVQQVQWFQHKALSRALHGPVQAAVTAAAIRIDQAQRAGSASPVLIEEIRGSLLASVDVLEASRDVVGPIGDTIDRIIATWDGVCTITVDLDPAAADCLARDEVLRSCTVDLMTEAASNAVRHGRARQVGIRLVCRDQLLELTVVDDGGAGPAPAGDREPGSPAKDQRGGLGTRILDECALEWHRTPADRGSVLVARLPTA